MYRSGKARHSANSSGTVKVRLPAGRNLGSRLTVFTKHGCRPDFLQVVVGDGGEETRIIY